MGNFIPPSFFIIGAPKCGTTSLSWYLGQHPEIIAPIKKEPNFFSIDLPLSEVDGLEEYLSLFIKTSEDQVVSFEASTWYLYSREAVKEILKFNKESKFIVLIRNPVEMAQSLHSQQVYNLGEPILDFETAWHEQFGEERKSDWLLHYKKCCETGRQLEDLLDTVEESRVMLILFEDLKNNPEKVYLDVQDFIGVREHRLVSYDKKNSNKVVRFRRLKKVFNDTPKPIYFILSVFKKITGIKELGIYDKVKAINEVERNRKGISEEFRRFLVQEFSSEIDKLENIFGRDLSHWRS